MAYLTCALKSQVMQRTVNLHLYFPNDLPQSVGNRPRAVFTLLHGFSNSGEDWFQMSAAARYAADNGLVLVAPDCGNSFYNNMMYGGAWRTFLIEELPLLLNDMFRLPQGRDKNFVVGLSMGGYGALYLGLTRPDLYGGCASFSGAVDLRMMLRHTDAPGLRAVFAPVFGDSLALPRTSDLFEIVRKCAALPADKQPRILLTNGLQDVEPYQIVAQNDHFHKLCSSLHLAHYRRLQWNGVHEWNFWDRSLVYAIDYFLNNGYANKKLGDWRSSAVASE